MPIERFLRLSEEKKAAILRASMDEFSRAPFDKVSINQIIKNAEISRGSFYTYFEDKMDLLRYIFQDTKQQYQDFCRKSLVENNGDFWKMVEDMFHEVLYKEYSSQLARLIRNVLTYAEAEKFVGMLRESCGDGCSMDEWMYERVDKSSLRTETLEEFRVLSEMCMMAVVMAFFQKNKDGKAIDAVEQTFFRKISILKYGALKHKEN